MWSKHPEYRRICLSMKFYHLATRWRQKYQNMHHMHTGENNCINNLHCFQGGKRRNGETAENRWRLLPCFNKHPVVEAAVATVIKRTCCGDGDAAAVCGDIRWMLKQLEALILSIIILILPPTPTTWVNMAAEELDLLWAAEEKRNNPPEVKWSETLLFLETF